MCSSMTYFLRCVLDCTVRIIMMCICVCSSNIAYEVCVFAWRELGSAWHLVSRFESAQPGRSPCPPDPLASPL